MFLSINPVGYSRLSRDVASSDLPMEFDGEPKVKLATIFRPLSKFLPLYTFILEEENDTQDDETMEDETPPTHQQKLQRLRQNRRNKMKWRKKAEFQPVVGEVRVEPRRAETRKRQRLLESM